MASAEPTQRPNFLVIVADDLGYSDCGCYGSEIKTPCIDALAQDGLRFTSFHVAAACSPTRAMLMTGTDHHLTGLGQLSEYVRNVPAYQGKPGHEGHLLESMVTLPELLRRGGGYRTVMSGKWHLGLKKEHGPAARGFDRSFALLPGCANHYGFEPQYQDDEAIPALLETAVTALHAEDGEYLAEVPDRFYSSDFYADKLIEYLREDGQRRPFFAYLPFSAPHWPLQAPKESCDKYRDMYSEGPAALRLRRLARLKEMGLVSENVVPHEVVTGGADPGDWEDMLPEERAKSARSMETYAGMVDRMDENIGRVIQYLKESDQYDNTVILFMSDNGAEGASYEARPIMGENVMRHIHQYYDNSLDNIGRHDSFVWYGARWAQAATAPSRLFKMFSTEGGCRVPLVLKPQKGSQGQPYAVTDEFCTVMDVVPTILDLASVKIDSSSLLLDRPLQKMRGHSWKTFLDAFAQGTHGDITILDPEAPVGWEVCGSGALRKGRYKITYVPAPKGPQRWELFDILDDPGETRDLSSDMPELLQQMVGHWEVYKREVGVVGLAGELKDVPLTQDEFEDVGKWIRTLGKEHTRQVAA